MNKIDQAADIEGAQVNVKIRLSALWAALMFLYVYADIFKLFTPFELERIMEGRQGPVPTSQASLFTASVLMLLPAVMVFLSLTLRFQVNRWTNIILGALYTVVNTSNLIGETWAFYVLFGIVEIVLTVLIAAYAWRWRSPAGVVKTELNAPVDAS